ncbi:helix-turn-helix transcriptional regulator [Xanthobacter autotrophicus]|uniref:helix-turn-helix transcriptional regulator n=1 Tax=Xanthobacter autotrophicus TaxID=280 RepID=UPI0024A73E22|nr:AlpA family phage regulatory protein [Xanthobacter autotrophicus]MDI4655363.1 AlpA family phage regulatory protein [Xanthobacter autotrophicus]
MRDPFGPIPDREVSHACLLRGGTATDGNALSPARHISAEQILLSRAEVRALGIPGSNVTWLRNEARGRFPRRIRIGGTRVCWDRTEILNWIEERRAERAQHVYADYA